MLSTLILFIAHPAALAAEITQLSSGAQGVAQVLNERAMQVGVETSPYRVHSPMTLMAGVRYGLATGVTLGLGTEANLTKLVDGRIFHVDARWEIHRGDEWSVILAPGMSIASGTSPYTRPPFTLEVAATHRLEDGNALHLSLGYENQAWKDAANPGGASALGIRPAIGYESRAGERHRMDIALIPALTIANSQQDDGAQRTATFAPQIGAGYRYVAPHYSARLGIETGPSWATWSSPSDGGTLIQPIGVWRVNFGVNYQFD